MRWPMPDIMSLSGRMFTGSRPFLKKTGVAISAVGIIGLQCDPCINRTYADFNLPAFLLYRHCLHLRVITYHLVRADRV